MHTYYITSRYHNKVHVKSFPSQTDARHWVINTLDLSGDDWTITETEIDTCDICGKQEYLKPFTQFCAECAIDVEKSTVSVL